MALIEFKDKPNTTTPINATNLNNNFSDLDNRSIYESGSNEKGDYIKFNDGTMICFGYNSYAWQPFELEGNVYISNELTIELPQEFKPKTLTNWRVIEVHGIASSGIYWCTASYFKSDKIAGIRFAKATSGNSDIYFDYIAIGKWK